MEISLSCAATTTLADLQSSTHAATTDLQSSTHATTLADLQSSTHAATTTSADLQSSTHISSMPQAVTISTSSSANPSSSSSSSTARNKATTSASVKTVPFLLPTVGGVAPRPDSTSTNRWRFYLAVTVVAAVGGLLLLMIILLGIISLLTAAKRGRERELNVWSIQLTVLIGHRRKHEISTSEQTELNPQYGKERKFQLAC